MLIRICLIIAIVAGIATGVVGFMKVGERLTLTMTERDQERAEKEKTKSDLSTTNKFLKASLADLSNTKAELSTTKTALQNITARANEHERRATDLATQVDRVKTERDTAQQELERWRQVPLSPDQVKGLLTDFKKVQEARDGMIGENKILMGKVDDLQRKLKRYEGDDVPPPMRAGLKGKVLAVDPKFDFVVLDIGTDQGVLEKGELLVSRQGKLIGKIKVTTVEPNRSVANVMPGWKQDEIMEGDLVLY